MSLPAALAAATGRAVAGARRIGGGDINEAWDVDFQDGGRAFLKTRTGAAAGEYETEAASLRWLAEPGALRVPAVLAVGGTQRGPRFLALEWVEQGGLDAAGEESLGRGLAALHGAGAPAFGAPPPGGSPAMRIGPLELPGGTLPTWPGFYAERRLRPLLRMATDRHVLGAGAVAAVERVCARMSELAGPPEPPARLHGDLWSGNVLAGVDGGPWLIDPAAYGGHRELDIAMLRLFGSPGRRVLAAYAEAAPLAAAHEDRVELWQLFPLLVHAILFGGSYVAAVERVARRYMD